jgi:hypothetical protein
MHCHPSIASGTEVLTTDRFHRWIVGILALIYAVFLLGTLDWHGYFSDELHTINAIKLPWIEMIQERAIQGHPPLFFVLEKAWMSFLPESEISCRALPALFGVGTLVLTYCIALRHAGGAAAALSSILVAASGTQCLTCHLARSYTLLQLLLTANMALVLSPEKPSWRRLIGSSLLCFAAMATHGSAFIAVPVQLLSTLLVEPKKSRIVIAMGIGFLTYCAMTLSLGGLTVSEQNINWIPPATAWAWLRFPVMLIFGRQVELVPGLFQAAIAAIVYLCVVSSMYAARVPMHLAIQWLLTVVVNSLAAIYGSGVLSIERYYAPIVVTQALLIAIYASNLTLRPRLASFGVVAVIASWSVLLYLMYPPFTPWREMAHTITLHRRADERVQVLTFEVLASPFSHYYDGPVVYVNSENARNPSGKVNGLWLCFQEFNSNSDMRIPENLKERFSHMKIKVFSHGALVHMRVGGHSQIP